MAPQHRFSCYLTLANSVGDSSRVRGVHELTMIEYPAVSDRPFCHGARSFHLTPLPRVGHAPNGRTDPFISSTTPCGMCPACLAMSGQAPNSRTDPFISSTTPRGTRPACLAMSHPLMELFMFQPHLGS